MFGASFFRAYDMDDDVIEVLRRRDPANHTPIDVGSVRFRINLPLAVSVDNPVIGANQVAEAALKL